MSGKLIRGWPTSSIQLRAQTAVLHSTQSPTVSTCIGSQVVLTPVLTLDTPKSSAIQQAMDVALGLSAYHTEPPGTQPASFPVRWRQRSNKPSQGHQLATVSNPTHQRRHITCASGGCSGVRGPCSCCSKSAFGSCFCCMQATAGVFSRRLRLAVPLAASFSLKVSFRA